jgi:hypothetical protein
MQTVNATLDNYTDTFRRTDKFVGMRANRRRQALTVTAAWEVIHGPKFPNTGIVAQVTLTGNRGAEYAGYVYRSGFVAVIG